MANHRIEISCQKLSIVEMGGVGRLWKP